MTPDNNSNSHEKQIANKSNCVITKDSMSAHFFS